MCGIAGFCNMPFNWKTNIHNMNNAMYDRGPDFEGIFCSDDGSCVLGHRRLAIHDLSESGNQPMISHDGRYVIVFNGEIYNYEDLKEILEKKWHISFRGKSDTEILLAWIEKKGIAGINDCIGMFGIAVYDREKNVLSLVRDRIGEKPLFYGFINGHFIFGSNLDAIKAHDEFNNEINYEILSLYFRGGYIPQPYTIYKEVYKLKPGTILTLDLKSEKYKIDSYWSLMERSLYYRDIGYEGTYEDAKNELEKMIHRSIKQQCLSDVPVGAFLSAGIDSTTIVAIMQAQSSSKIKTFSIGMEGSDRDESVRAKKIAEYIGTDHTEFILNEKYLAENLVEIITHTGEPFADSSIIPSTIVSRLAKKNVTVALTGDGGDELFCGYNRYIKYSSRWDRIKFIPYFIRNKAAKLISHICCICEGGGITTRRILSYLSATSPMDMYRISGMAGLSHPLTQDSGQCVYTSNIDSYPESYMKHPMENLMLIDQMQYLPDDILFKVDSAGMSVSLETRMPLLSKEIIEFSWRIPLEFKYSNGMRKKILKDILYKYVPPDLMEMPKRGFSIPVSEWLRKDPLKGWGEELIQKSNICEIPFLNGGQIKQIWLDYQKKGVWTDQIWFLLIFLNWINK